MMTPLRGVIMVSYSRQIGNEMKKPNTANKSASSQQAESHPKRYQRDELLSATELRERGWTESMIKRILGDPDDTRPNPRYKHAGHPMRFWSRARVDQIETTDEFRERAQQAKKRSAKAKETAARQAKTLAELVANIEVIVPEMPFDELIQQTIEHYNERGTGNYLGKRDWNPIDEDTDTDYLNRQAVNYLRHEHTQYEEEIEALSGKVGKNDALLELRVRVLEAIESTYPELYDECRRQIEVAEEAAEMSSMAKLFPWWV